MEKILTIAIPTYNRKKQLIRLLKSIESQGCQEKYTILISDNCSDYSVEEAINEEFSGDFRATIEVMRREINGGGDYNISSIFQYCKSKLFWLVGDDDEFLPGAIYTVLDYYERYPEIPLFKYIMGGAIEFDEDIRLKTVDDLNVCHKKGYLRGGIIFMSNNIYNMDLLKPYLSDCLYYGYCSIGQILPMMHCLVDSDYEVLLCKEQIVKYNDPEGDGWNYIKVVTSISTVLDINWNNKYREIKKFFNIVSSYFGLGQFLIDNVTIPDKQYRKYIYWKGINTVFKNHYNILDLFALTCYWIERITHIKTLTGLYKGMLNFQEKINTRFREKTKTNATAARCYKFLKKHVKLMK